jgi:UDP-N-acetylglucosamine acyltransferase
MIHETAIIHARTRIADDVEIGPLCVVGAGVDIDSEARLLSHVVLTGPSRIGAGVVIHPFAVIGGPPQDRSHTGEPTTLEVGERSVIREHVTIHRGTKKDRGTTRVGKRTLLMAGAHVAHDVVVGDDCTITNAVQLGGHAVIGDHVTIGAAAAVGPFVRIGEGAFIAAGALVEQDVPPFHIAQGDRARVRALNVVGLERRGVSPGSVAALERAHRLLYRSGHPLSVGVSMVRADACATDSLVAKLLAFIDTAATLAPGPQAPRGPVD